MIYHLVFSNTTPSKQEKGPTFKGVFLGRYPKFNQQNQNGRFFQGQRSSLSLTVINTLRGDPFQDPDAIA